MAGIDFEMARPDVQVQDEWSDQVWFLTFLLCALLLSHFPLLSVLVSLFVLLIGQGGLRHRQSEKSEGF